MKAIIEHASPSLLSPARFVARALVVAFVLVCVFDPADRVVGLKVWIFLALWPATLAVGILTHGRIQLPVDLLIMALLFILIPVLSIVWYYLASGVEPYAGFALLKGYLFVSLAIILFINETDVLPVLSAALTLLALLTVAIFVALSLHPGMFLALHELGVSTGIFLVSYRSYGEGLLFTQVAFATAPMLTIAVSYYFDCAASGAEMRQRLAYWGLTALGIVAMLLVGLRNTMAVALLLPSFLWPLYTRRPWRNALISLAVLIGLSLPFVGKLRAFLNPAEQSNNTKLMFLGDYAHIFSDPLNLIVGQGLGAFYKWSTSGLPEFEKTGSNFYFISELTYPEMVRSFGLVGAAVMLALVLYPVGRAFLMSSTTTQRALATGFLAYLGMSATNPLLFSSSGMLIWTALLVVSFRRDVAAVAGQKHDGGV